MKISKINRAVLSITNKCNLKCIHCYNSVQRKTDVKCVFTEAFFKDLKNIGCEQIGLSGGEPLLEYPLLKQLLGLTRQYKFNTILTTNGTLLTDSVLSELQALGVDIFQISLDGHDEQTHDILRGKGSAAKMWRLITGGINRDYRIVPVQVIHKLNYQFLPEFLRLLIDNGFATVGFERFIPSGSGQEHLNLCLSANELKKAYDTLLEFEGKIKIHVNDPVYTAYKLIRKGVSSQLTEFLATQYDFGCTAYRSSVVVDSNGDVRSCTFSPKVLFSLSDMPIGAVIPIFDENKKIALTGKCGKCVLQNMCKGCRAYAELCGVDWNAEDPLCFIQ